MKSYNITEDQIKEIHNVSNDEWKDIIEQWFTEVFETKLEVGKWYFNDETLDYLICYQTKEKSYGFIDCVYSNDWYFDVNDKQKTRLATEEELKEALIKEAKKRGFKEGVKFQNFNGTIQTIEGELYFNRGSKQIHCHTPKEEWYNEGSNSNPYIFYNGKWAEIIEEEIKVVENEEPTPRYTVTFETLGAVTVTLEGNNLDNLMAIAKDNNLR